MGQAQSQSSGGDCGDCFGAYGMIFFLYLIVESIWSNGIVSDLDGRDDHPDPLKSVSSSHNGYPQIQASSTGKYDGGYHPTQSGSVGQPNQSTEIRNKFQSEVSTANYSRFQIMEDFQQIFMETFLETAVFPLAIVQLVIRTIWMLVVLDSQAHLTTFQQYREQIFYYRACFQACEKLLNIVEK